MSARSPSLFVAKQHKINIDMTRIQVIRVLAAQKNNIKTNVSQTKY